MNRPAAPCKHVGRRTTTITRPRHYTSTIPDDTRSVDASSASADSYCPGSPGLAGDTCSKSSQGSRHSPSLDQPRSQEPPAGHDTPGSGGACGSDKTDSGDAWRGVKSPLSEGAWADDSDKESGLSVYLLYTAVCCGLLGLTLFLLLRSGPQECHICNEVVTEARDIPPKKLSFADKIDFASDANGACIELHDTYHYIKREAFAAGDLLRLPAVAKVAPDVMLKDDDTCFAMQGHTGTFMIRLSRPIVVSSVTLVHNKEECDAAPKEFIVYGVKDPKEKVPVSLGRFQYENRGQLAQKFAVPSFDEVGFVGLKIVSNWGNKDYTCVTKIKVHGEPQF